AFEVYFKKYSHAELLMVYNNDKLEAEVRSLINNSEILRAKVRLLGELAHADLDNYYSSSDYFVLGSHQEGSGFALCEALACGCVPVVTNIPSFRMMTDNGRIGALWQAGNDLSLIQALEKV